MLQGVGSAFSDDIAIDLGTANTLVHVAGRGIIIDEPSVVAVRSHRGTREILAVGRKAKALIGRAPESIELVRPLRDGVIADFVATEEMLRQFIKRTKSMLGFRRPRILICVPAQATPVERRAVYDTAVSVGARKVYLIAEPVAASLGAGLPIDEPGGAMVVDIGGGTSDIAVLSSGVIVLGAHAARRRQRHGRRDHPLRAPPAPADDRRGERRAHQDRGRHGAGDGQRPRRRGAHPRPRRAPGQRQEHRAAGQGHRRGAGRAGGGDRRLRPARAGGSAPRCPERHRPARHPPDGRRRAARQARRRR